MNETLTLRVCTRCGEFSGAHRLLDGSLKFYFPSYGLPGNCRHEFVVAREEPR